MERLAPHDGADEHRRRADMPYDANVPPPASQRLGGGPPPPPERRSGCGGSAYARHPGWEQLGPPDPRHPWTHLVAAALRPGGDSRSSPSVRARDENQDLQRERAVLLGAWACPKGRPGRQAPPALCAADSGWRGAKMCAVSSSCARPGADRSCPSCWIWAKTVLRFLPHGLLQPDPMARPGALPPAEHGAGPMTFCLEL